LELEEDRPRTELEGTARKRKGEERQNHEQTRQFRQKQEALYRANQLDRLALTVSIFFSDLAELGTSRTFTSIT